MAVTGVAAAVALVVVVLSAISERPVPGLRIAVVPAAAVLVLGLLWVFIVYNRRRQGLWRPFGRRESMVLLFSPLPRHIYLGIFVVFAIGWLSAVISAVVLANGVPSAGRPACTYPAYYHGSMVCISKSAWLAAVAAEGGGAAAASHVTVNSLPSATGRHGCPYRADDHGTSTCLSKSAWLRAGAAEEREVAGVMLGLFAADFGVAWSEVLRSRQARQLAGAG
jgi:hypothetical protein